MTKIQTHGMIANLMNGKLGNTLVVIGAKKILL